MKKALLLLSVIFMIVSCNNSGTQNATDSSQPKQPVTASLTQEELKNKSFNDLFTSIQPAEISESVFKLVGSDYTVITSGKPEDYNSMVASFGGWGILFEKPTTWCFLRANRHTLNYIRKEQTYTMAYFDAPFKEQIMIFGTKSGKDTNKMKEHTLTAVQTPSGSTSYKEAKLIIECKLIELTTVSPNDFYTQEGKDFVAGAYDEAKDYHKLVFGEITDVWTRK